MKSQTSTLRAASVALLLFLPFASGSARAEEPGQPPADSAAHEIGWKDVALFAGGAATAFLAHEAGHTITNLSLGHGPHLESVRFLGFVPFFAVSPEVSCIKSSCFKSDGSRFEPGQRGVLL